MIKMTYTISGQVREDGTIAAAWPLTNTQRMHIGMGAPFTLRIVAREGSRAPQIKIEIEGEKS